MGTIFKFVNKLIILILLFGFITAGVDYFRMKNGEIPIFNQSQYELKSGKQTFKGLFYRAERKVLASPDEALTDSSNIQYKLFLFPLNVSSQKKSEKIDFQILGQNNLECNDLSKLYFANLDIKVYTYCLDDIFIKEKTTKTLLSYLEKDDSILNRIHDKFGYKGIYQNIMEFSLRDVDSLENGLVMYQCQGINMNDIYFAPIGTLPQNDFCTYKDDDFSFIFEVVDESGEGLDSQGEKEVFFEDLNYIYQVDRYKSDYLFAVAPEVRGKAAVKISLKAAVQAGILTMEQVTKKANLFEKISKETNLNEEINGS